MRSSFTMRHPLHHIAVLICLLAASAWGQTDGQEFFTTEVRPILESECFRCHGTKANPKAGLRLVHRKGLLTGGDQGPAFGEADPAASLLLRMVSYKDEHHQMPPDGKLKQEDLDTLTEWIRRGAPYDAASEQVVISDDEPEGAPKGRNDGMEGWSYRPLVAPAVPTPQHKEQVRNPIDAFVLEKLEPLGLKLSEEADRHTLIRRLSWDLVGLPPTPEQITEFLDDQNPGAYDSLVDRLLSSPHYGERWGRHWLDLVRYADTNGFERDSDKPFMWRYRDYVIRSLNEDKPYDQFVLEQLAGDEVPEPTRDSMIATGYFRLMQWDDEPGAGALQARYDVLNDILDTTTQALMGMTIGCARCHNHKGDAIPQKDYYRLLAYFHGVTDMSLKGHLAPAETSEERAEFERRSAERKSRIENLQSEIHDIETRFFDAFTLTDAASLPTDLTDLSFRFYRDTFESLPDFDKLRPEEAGQIDGGLVTLAVASRKSAIGLVYEGTIHVPSTDRYRFFLKTVGHARLLINDAEVIAANHPQKEGQRSAEVDLKGGPATFRLELAVGDAAADLAWSWERLTQPPWQYATSKPTDDWASPEFDDGNWKQGIPGFGSPGTKGAVIRTEWRTQDIWMRRRFDWNPTKVDDLRFAIQHDDHTQVYLNGVLAWSAKGYITDYALFRPNEKALATLKPTGNLIAVHCEQDFGGQSIHVEPVSAQRADTGLSAVELAFRRRPLSINDANSGTTKGREQVLRRNMNEVLGQGALHRWNEARTNLEKARKRKIPRRLTPAVQEHGPNVPETHLLVRGNAHVKGDRVEPLIPAVLGGVSLPVSKPSRNTASSGRRLAFAKWLTSPTNPVLARVLANRVWGLHFGTYIVTTPNDFGEFGERPTHPELLDHLASAFIRDGFSLKSLHRQIVRSATYRQSSARSDLITERDPASTQYARFQVRRLDAELVRDGILATAGILNPKMGGKGFFSKMPKAMLATSSRPEETWGQSPETERRRRSIYIKVKRSLLTPMLTSFDMADSDIACAGRFSTTQPSQALSLVNGAFTELHAPNLIARLSKETGGSIEAMVKRASLIIAGRPAEPREIEEDLTFIASLRQDYNLKQDRALALYAIALWNTNGFLYVH